MSYTERLNGYVVVNMFDSANGVLIVYCGPKSFTFRGVTTMKPEWDMLGATVKLTAKDGYVRLRNMTTNNLIGELYVEGVK